MPRTKTATPTPATEPAPQLFTIPAQVTEVNISYKCQYPEEKRNQVFGSDSAEKILRPLFPDDKIEMQEFFIVLLLNKASKVIGYSQISAGGMSGTVVDVKILFATALKALASAIIIAHNHPSGSLTPSQADIELTRRIKKGSELLDIPLLDHLILSPVIGSYYSFADECNI